MSTCVILSAFSSFPGPLFAQSPRVLLSTWLINKAESLMQKMVDAGMVDAVSYNTLIKARVQADSICFCLLRVGFAQAAAAETMKEKFIKVCRFG